jgi:hypothetical protein
VDAPSEGHEWLARISYTVRRKMEAYMQLKNEVKEENADSETGPFSTLAARKRFQSRLHLSWQLTKSLEWRSRLDAGFTEFEGEKETGVALSQDLIYKAVGSPFSFSTRFAIFDTDGFNVRFYSYENDLLNDFSIPAYYNRGTRVYLNLRYRLNRSLITEARFARTYYTNVDVIGSGLDEINGPAKTDVKAQIKWEF